MFASKFVSSHNFPLETWSFNSNCFRNCICVQHRLEVLCLCRYHMLLQCCEPPMTSTSTLGFWRCLAPLGCHGPWISAPLGSAGGFTSQLQWRRVRFTGWQRWRLCSACVAKGHEAQKNWAFWRSEAKLRLSWTNSARILLIFWQAMQG